VAPAVATRVARDAQQDLEEPRARPVTPVLELLQANRAEQKTVGWPFLQQLI